MNEIILTIIGIAVGFVLGYALKRREYPTFQISIDKDGKPVITPIMSPISSTGQAEFIEEPTKGEIEELEKPTKLRKFLNKFKKPEE